jgi:hypothetical protein
MSEATSAETGVAPAISARYSQQNWSRKNLACALRFVASVIGIIPTGDDFIGAEYDAAGEKL